MFVPGLPCRWAVGSWGSYGTVVHSCLQPPRAAASPEKGRPTLKGTLAGRALAHTPWPDLAAPRARGQEAAGLVLSERPVLALSIRWGSLRKLGKSQWLRALGEAASWRWLQPSLTGRLPNSCLCPGWTEPGQRSSWPFPGGLVMSWAQASALAWERRPLPCVMLTK